MSSTKRNGKRNDKDYYITPPFAIIDFAKSIVGEVPTIFDGLILDPCEYTKLKVI